MQLQKPPTKFILLLPSKASKPDGKIKERSPGLLGMPNLPQRGQKVYSINSMPLDNVRTDGY